MSGKLSQFVFPQLLPVQRVSRLSCPECSVAMIPFSCRGHVVEKCPLCNGIWFSGKSFGAFRDTLHEFDLSKIDFAPGISPARTEAICACPRCAVVLSPFRYAYNTKVHLGRCDRCRGLWLPFPELLNVLDLAKVGQDIAPHVRGFLAETTKIDTELRRDREVTGAMRKLSRPVSPWRVYGFYRLSILLPLYDNVPRASAPFATLALIGLNTVIFLAAIFSGAFPDFVKALAFVPGDFPSTAGFIAAFTHQFMHAGVVHLIGNMFFLWLFGDNVEDRFGVKRFVPFYLFCGLAAALTETAGVPGSMRLMVGASGAISGVLGAYLLLFPHATVTTLILGTLVDLPTWVYLFLWLAVQLIGGFVFAGSDGGPIAWWAHIGGFACGVVITWLLLGLGLVERQSAEEELNFP